jgi:hypothetical protein
LSCLCRDGGKLQNRIGLLAEEAIHTCNAKWLRENSAR